MNLPSKEQLPLRATEQIFEVNQSKLTDFHKAFKDKLTYTPPTLMAVAMKGIFDLVNSFNVDWRKLLHATQSFSYLKKLDIPCTVKANVSLQDIKFRAQIHWLQFEIKITEAKTGEDLISGKTLILVRENL